MTKSFKQWKQLILKIHSNYPVRQEIRSVHNSFIARSEDPSYPQPKICQSTLITVTVLRKIKKLMNIN